MFRDELRHRVKRIAGGDCRYDDIDRILLSLRDKSGDRGSIRELGDFIAQREQRESGLLTTKARDVFLGFHSRMQTGTGHAYVRQRRILAGSSRPSLLPRRPNLGRSALLGQPPKPAVR